MSENLAFIAQPATTRDVAHPATGARARAADIWGGSARVDQPAIAGAARVRADDWSARLRLQMAAADLTVAALAAGVTYLLRFGFTVNENIGIAAAAPFVWVAVLAGLGAFSKHALGVGSEEYRTIGKAAAVLLAAVALLSYLFDLELARAFVLPLVATLFLGTLVTHQLARKRLEVMRFSGQYLSSVVVVGRVDTAASIIRELRNPATGMRVIGACVSSVDHQALKSTEIEGVPVLGTPADALEVIDRLGADVAAVASDPDLSGPKLRRLGWALAERQVGLVVSPGIMEVAGPRLTLRPAAGLSLLHVERPSSGGARALTKQAMDRVLAFCILLAAMPVGLAVAAAIKLTSPGPVFFKQERVGAHGELFKMIKFRSMVVDAEARKAALAETTDAGNEVLFKVKADPRITKVGAVIRRYSIDELPQLINVLKGEMSLVGPRPSLPVEVRQYESDAFQRLRVRPGLTGLWQVSGRSDLDWEQSLRLDLWYVDNWSPMLDLHILARTARAVVGGAGAY